MCKELLTYSSLKCLANCQQKYCWRYERGMRLRRDVGGENHRIGSAAHAGRDAYNRGSSIVDAALVARASIATTGLGDEVRAAQARRAKAAAIVRRSVELWPERAERSEQVFRTNIVNPRTNLSLTQAPFCSIVTIPVPPRFVCIYQFSSFY